jgi:hypothetical protein
MMEHILKLGRIALWTPLKRAAFWQIANLFRAQPLQPGAN